MARSPARDPEPDLFGHTQAKAPAADARWPPDDLQPGTLAEARQMAVTCTRCDLYKNATQTVFGEGPPEAAIMLVGEQPGDQEDLQGRPFVGPAGKVLDRALADAGIDRQKLYVSNGVKHFKNEPRGKKRLHKRPDISEIAVCAWWLDIERRMVKPKVVVALGATGLRAVTGRSAPIASLRGRPSRLPDGTILIVTIHPSYLLRMPDRDAAEAEYGRFVADLAAAEKAAA
jgi:uracil-DNA glycosylase